MRPEAAVQVHHFEAMGTSCSLFAVNQPRGRLLEGEFWVRRLSAGMTRFNTDSELSRLNACAGKWMEVSDDLESILRAALSAYAMSAGLVNVAVLPSMHAIGYTRPLAEGPSVATLDGARPLRPLPEVLEVRDREAMVAFGSGLDLGGDLSAVGLGPRGDGWPVGVAGQTLMLRDQGAATSSVRRRRWGGLHHLIDPRSGLPAISGLEEVSVVAASGFEAEVVAKTALLLGPAVGPAYCAAHAMAWWLGGARDD